MKRRRDRLPAMIAVDERLAGRLADALMFMRARIDAPPRLEEIAAVAGFSPFHFHRIFKAATGEGPSEFVVRHRLERAAFELRSTQQRITQIATRCGYETPSAFARAFAAKFGMSPSAFRASRSEPVPAPSHALPHGSHTHPDVRIETFEPQHLLGMHHVGPYTTVGPTWDALLAIAAGRASSTSPRAFWGCRTTIRRRPAKKACCVTTPASPWRRERVPADSRESSCPAGGMPCCATAARTSSSGTRSIG
jgi:AraC-like DNA-binding protein